MMFTEVVIGVLAVAALVALLTLLFAPRDSVWRIIAPGAFVLFAVITFFMLLVTFVPGEDAYGRRLQILAVAAGVAAICFGVCAAVRRSSLYVGASFWVRRRVRPSEIEALDTETERQERRARLSWHQDLPRSV